MEMGWRLSNTEGCSPGKPENCPRFRSLSSFQCPLRPARSCSKWRGVLSVAGWARKLAHFRVLLGSDQPIKVPLFFPRLAGCHGDAEGSPTRPGELARSSGASVSSVQAVASPWQGRARATRVPHHRAGARHAVLPYMSSRSQIWKTSSCMRRLAEEAGLSYIRGAGKEPSTL